MAWTYADLTTYGALEETEPETTPGRMTAVLASVATIRPGTASVATMRPSTELLDGLYDGPYYDGPWGYDDDPPLVLSAVAASAATITPATAGRATITEV